MAKELPDVLESKPNRQWLLEHPEDETVQLVVMFYRTINEEGNVNTLPDMMELMYQFRRIREVVKGHRRFSGVEVGLVSRREIRGVAEAIRLAARNLRDQADYLESSK